MAHYVKCCYCGEQFNRDKIPCVPVGRRYAHVDCANAAAAGKAKEELDYENLIAYIKGLFHIDKLNQKIVRQLREYKEDKGYTYSGIHKSLVYFFEIKRNSIEKANGGIGIVPYIYDDAKAYYTAIWMANKQNEEKAKAILPEALQQKTVVITIPRPVPKKKPMFTFLDEEAVQGGV